MKKILFIIGLVLLACLAGCTNSGGGENTMKDYNITIIGKINENEVVVNPLFYWDRANADSAFTVEVSLDGEVIETREVTSANFQVSKLLNPNSEYVLKVTGKESKHQSSITFKTITNYNNTVNSITLGNPFSNGMVIQRNVDTILAGTGPALQLISVVIEDERYDVISDNDGNFEVTIPGRSASFNPISISVSNGVNASKLISDVLFGDVYLFAGQSNMQWPTMSADYTTDDLAKLKNSNVRFFCQDVVTSTTELESVKNGRWFKPNESNCLNFSAIATITGSILGTDLKDEVPIGIITAYQGDTNIANWMSSDYYKGTVSTKHLHYNAMVYPLRHTKLSGVVWYQGCNNSAAGCEYKDLLLALFANYRDLFNTTNLPFFVIGLACYDGDSGNNFDFSYVRESQALACKEDNNAYFISVCDDGDPTYIHPRAKHYICERVAKSIEAAVYLKDYYREGPSYKSHTINGNIVTIDLYNNDGLRSVGKISGLYLAGEDGKYYEATANISDGKIIASCEKVPNPVYIKYGFGKSPFVNIFNRDGYAITPFRTDNYNTNIDLLDYDSTTQYYFHPDGSKMDVSLNNGNLLITKQNDGKGYGSVRLDKWGAIAYQPQGFRFTVKGTNSGAAITFRAIEGDSYEIWGYKIIDDFTGEKTFSVGVGDFVVVYGKQNNIFEPQKIGYIEIMVEKNGEASFEVCEARFVTVERTKPMSFIISNVTENENNVSILFGNALFANSYTLVITNVSQSSPVVYTKEQEATSFTIDKALFKKGVPYYITAIAKNELGETSATNSGYVFYLKDDNEVVICNFDFKDQAALNAYIDSSMSVHNGLTCTLQDNGVKIASSGAGWQQFIFKLDTGAGKDMTKLVFYADFSNYKGDVVMQLADTSWNTYDYIINLSEKSEGIFTINFSDFKKSGTSFTTQTLMWVMFNFSDSVGNGYILLDDVKLLK